MIETSAAYKAAVVADVRKMVVKAVVDISDPDLTFGTVDGTSTAPYSKGDQLHDKVFQMGRPFATLEQNRWILDGGTDIVTDDNRQVGYVGNTLSGADGTFSPAVYVQMSFSNVAILQACSVYFTNRANDGGAVDFTVSVIGDTTYTQTFEGNDKASVSLSGFTVSNPTAIRVEVTKWSLPYRRLRVCEIVPGVYEEWTGDILAAFSINQRTAFGGLKLAYSTCSLRMDNLDRRFEPRNKAGLFQSLTERQGIKTYVGVDLGDTEELVPTGTYYQVSGGWKTGDNDLTMQWDMVDIIGLLASRQFLAPATLPTTVSGWAAALVSQLGANFAEKYRVDTDAALTCSADSVATISCGELLRYICMAAQKFPSADADGNLVLSALPTTGGELTLDNMARYPVIAANDDYAAIVFTFPDNTKYVVTGTSTASSNTANVRNPFITTQAQANAAAAWIFGFAGGNMLETVGRGDPASQLGDVDAIELDKTSTAQGRRVSQTLSFSNGVLQGCKSVFLEVSA